MFLGMAWEVFQQSLICQGYLYFTIFFSNYIFLDGPTHKYFHCTVHLFAILMAL